MAERLGVNIFADTLPGSYIFLDSCDDDSKWIQDAVAPWSAITVGDINGYYGKGLNFSIIDGAGAALDLHATRMILSTPMATRKKMYFGAVVRPNGTFKADASFGRYIDFMFCAPLSIGSSAVKFGIRIASAAAVGGIVIDQIKLLDWNRNVVGAPVGLSSQGVLIPHWIRFSGMVSWPYSATSTHLKLEYLQINSNTVKTNIDLSGLPGAFQDSGYVQIYGKKVDVDKDTITWDVDQVWVSDLEYRV